MKTTTKIKKAVLKLSVDQLFNSSIDNDTEVLEDEQNKLIEFIKQNIAFDWKKIIALAIELDLTVQDIVNEELKQFSYDDNRFEYGNQEYLVLDDSEADEANDERIESYIDECILPEIPENARRYFDYDKFKSDARDDGRGHNLATYDGEEREQKINDSWYFIYRTN